MEPCTSGRGGAGAGENLIEESAPQLHLRYDVSRSPFIAGKQLICGRNCKDAKRRLSGMNATGRAGPSV